jgi:4-hydroxybenzoate polyprenyltransferase
MNTTVFVEDFKKTTQRILPNIPTFSKKNATIELLKSSVLIAISGALRVYIACLLLRTQPSIITCAAGGLIIYSVYTLDRSLNSEEDIINRKELTGSKKEIGIAASVITFLTGGCVLAKEGLLEFVFLPLIIGFLYSKGINIRGFHLKLKGGIGSKNVVVGLIWGISIVGVAGSNCQNHLLLTIVFVFFGVKVIINSIIDDFKDIKGDQKAGINTLPIYYGEQKTRVFLLGLHVLTHIILSIAIIKGVIAFEPIIIICSFVCGLICILRYTNEMKYLSRKSEMTFFKDGEAALIIGLNVILNSI